MPEVSRFLGITVAMFYRELEAPHFHARYGEYAVQVDIETLRVTGRFPPRAMRIILEWAELHRAALRTNWQLAREGKPLRGIAPLE